ncbi:hypothetical protein DOK78_000866 [Enterococcus sp. DIV2402]|uniref:Methyltransferase domain-containing protein n=1 Tax=Candidatus Enterococcus lowellii TaxID=2230877 RepID=A0ABZ2SL19_9ENTE|nr:class I SAM-dependent methyltransferase [Enterococcus sp. DIV2402]MBO0465801.1 class I SAM-dependent methyltransferase [Enterococcus sp. DIV2402]
MFKEYGRLSTLLYEHTKPIGTSLDGDVEYYFEKLKNVSGPILEAGVGTGRMLIPLLKKGLDVDGVDLSNEMLVQCHTNLTKHEVTANIYQQDLLKLAMPRKYQAIIMPTGSFCLLSRDSIKDILFNFFSHLEDGGKLIVDLEMPIGFTEEKISQSHFLLDQDKGIIMTNFNETIDWFNQKTVSLSKYELVENGQVTQTEYSHFTMYWYGLNEFEMLLSLVGFVEIEREVGYGTDASEIITYIATKK